MTEHHTPTGTDAELVRHIASRIDHTLLRAVATEHDILQLCEEAVSQGFKAVCIPGAHLQTAAKALNGTPVELAAVVGFPLGHGATRSKCCEAEICLRDGASELDVVLNTGWMCAGQDTRIAGELAALRRAVPDTPLKLILETCYLNDEQKRTACRLAMDAGWEYVKTSTGFGPAGANLEDVRLMREVVSDRLGVKASGGIRDLEGALKYLRAGASRIGTSAGLAIAQAARAYKPE